MRIQALNLPDSVKVIRHLLTYSRFYFIIVIMQRDQLTAPFPDWQEYVAELPAEHLLAMVSGTVFGDHGQIRSLAGSDFRTMLMELGFGDMFTFTTGDDSADRVAEMRLPRNYDAWLGRLMLYGEVETPWLMSIRMQHPGKIATWMCAHVPILHGRNPEGVLSATVWREGSFTSDW